MLETTNHPSLSNFLQVWLKIDRSRSRVTMFAKKKGLETGVYKCQQDLSILEKSWDITAPSTL